MTSPGPEMERPPLPRVLLIARQEEEACVIIGDLLRCSGYQVTIVSDATAALRCLDAPVSDLPDYLMADMRLSGIVLVVRRYVQRAPWGRERVVAIPGTTVTAALTRVLASRGRPCDRGPDDERADAVLEDQGVLSFSDEDLVRLWALKRVWTSDRQFAEQRGLELHLLEFACWLVLTGRLSDYDAAGERPALIA